jgi:hypothetical protein
MERSVIRERPVRVVMPIPDYATEGGRSIRATRPRVPLADQMQIRYHSSTIRDHIDASTREEVVTNSKNLF